jgi:hypothetical protein
MFSMITTKGSNLHRKAAWVLCALFVYWLVWRAPLPFVSSWWRSVGVDSSSTLHVRHRMADWLVLTHALLGKTNAEVVNLLGQPPLHDKFRGAGLVYVLGPERSFVAIDYEWLLLTFGKAGTVENAAIVTD